MPGQIAINQKLKSVFYNSDPNTPTYNTTTTTA